MKTVFKKAHWMCTGLVLALACGTPALADDTEILMIQPQGVVPKPNVLFIIDSSGSMDDEVETKRLYDPDRDYDESAGGCDNDRLYWTETNVVPNCENDDNNQRWVDKADWMCAAAEKRLEGIGSYTGTVTQFRPIFKGGVAGIPLVFGGWTWTTMAAGFNDALTECRADRGVDGFINSGDPRDWVDKNADQENTSHWSTDPDDEIDWRGQGVSHEITFWDGNYLNYRAAPETTDERKIDIVEMVARIVLESVDNVNLGIMRFNDRRGGPVIQDIVDLEANRAALVQTIADIDADGRTPLSETLYESALFWHGQPAYYGENVDEHDTDPAALSQLDPEIYDSPEMLSCTKNYNVLLTDGEPNTDEETPDLVDNLPNWTAQLGYAGCTGTDEGDCLDDVAAWLSKEDIDPLLDGEQTVITHTIGFAIDLPVMKEAAERSGGDYFLADDVQSLTLALLKIVDSIQERSLSFSAPAVAVNSFNRTQNLNDLYLTTFGSRGKVHWPGNLKKYRIRNGQIVDSLQNPAVDPANGYFTETSQSFWSTGTDGAEVELGGAANQIPAPDNRNVYTYNGSDINLTGASNAISTNNSGSFSIADFGLVGAEEEPDLDTIIEWTRGADKRDIDNDEDFDEPRNEMGDPLHSQPAAVVYGANAGVPDVVIYTATNAGNVHAIDGQTGQELWTFMPKEQMTGLAKRFFDLPAAYKSYGVDGDIIPVIRDADNDGEIETGDGDFVIIIFGMRRGGDYYYALDVSNKNAPKFLWQFTMPDGGQSWSQPSVARVKMADGNGQNAANAVVVIGGGYDTVHDSMTHPQVDDVSGAGIYMLDLVSGQLLWRAGRDDDAQLTLTGMTRAIPTNVRAIDMNGDGFANRMYSTDVSGQVWRFDITNGNDPNGFGNNALVTGGVVARLGAEGNGTVGIPDTRRFYNAPDVSLFNDPAQNRRFVALSIGSGYRAHPLDIRNTDRFYSIRDENVFNNLTQDEFESLTPITEADLVDVSGSFGATIGAENAGWMFTLPDNQMVLTDSTTFDNEVFFVAFSPDADNVEAETCAAGVGRNFLYRVSVINGDPIADLDNAAQTEADSLRVTDLAQGGIAPSPRFLFPTPDNSCGDNGDENCNPPALGCVGIECFDPGFPNNPVRTLWTADGIE